MGTIRALVLTCLLAAPLAAQGTDPGAEADACAAAIEAAHNEQTRAPHRLRLARALLALSEQDGVSRLEEVRGELLRVTLALPPELEEAEPALLSTAFEALALLAKVEARLGDPEATRRAEERLTALRKQVADAVARIREEAAALRDKRDYPGAIERLDQALVLDPASGEAYYDRGTCHLKAGSFVPGVLDFARAIEHQPRVADAVTTKLYQIAYVTDVDRVIREVDAMAAERPREAAVVCLRGMFRLAKVEWKPPPTPEGLAAAIADFDRALELNPRHAMALAWRAQMRLRRAQHALDPAAREADLSAVLLDLAKVEELDPESQLSPFLAGLHWSLRAGEPGLPEAEAAARRARALDALATARERGWKPHQPEKERGFDPIRSEPRFAELVGKKS